MPTDHVTSSGPEPDGATPLDPDEAADLVPSHITTRAELNAWEQANIAAGAQWASRSGEVEDVLTIPFLTELHRRMLGDTWTWAGRFRTTGKNIGVPAANIGPQLRSVLDDVSYWLKHETYQLDEIGARLHHRLVVVHPFVNGNGRHSRLLVDTLLTRAGARPFSWGSRDLNQGGEIRALYLRALRRADVGDYSELLDFVRS